MSRHAVDYVVDVSDEIDDPVVFAQYKPLTESPARQLQYNLLELQDDLIHGRPLLRIHVDHQFD